MIPPRGVFWTKTEIIILFKKVKKMTEERKFQYDRAYMNMAYAMSELSYAQRHKVGSIIVSSQGQVISQGYNGTPAGLDNCCEIETRVNENKCECCLKVNCQGCDNIKLVTKPEVLHAETNAISKCAKWMSSTQDATLYVTLSPCIDCAKLIIQSGIKRVVFNELYRNTDGIKILQKVGIIVEQIDLDNNTLKTVHIYEKS